MRALALIPLGAALALAGCGGSSSPTTTAADAPVSATPTKTAISTSAKSSVSILAAQVHVTPAHAGTIAAPQPVRLRVSLRLRQPAGVDPPLARTADLTLSPGARFQPDVTPTCDLKTLKAQGADGCAPASIIGSGTAVGIADEATTTGTITVVNGGPGHIYLATIVRHPAYVKTIVPGDVTATGGKDGGLRVHFNFPGALQNVAGVPLGLQTLTLTMGRGAVFATTSCDDGHWTYEASVVFADATAASRRGALSCS